MKNKHSNNKTVNVYEIVNKRITDLLDKGVVPWHQPWAKSGSPKNLISGKNYRGINIWLLNSLGYSQNQFLTFKQIKELGGSIKNAEKACPVIFWKKIEKENKETKKNEIVSLLRYYNVFNVEQCTGIPKEKLPQVIEMKNDPIQTCEQIITNMPKRPDIRHIQNRAYYNKIDDFINMPKIEHFKDSQSYYSTLFHELAHSTGHQERLYRREVTEKNIFGSKDYSQEELTAEMAASYLKSHAGIPIEKLENNAAYIHHWLEHLKKDQKCFIHACAQAQKATDYILNIKNEEIEIQHAEKENERTLELKHLRKKETEISIDR